MARRQLNSPLAAVLLTLALPLSFPASALADEGVDRIRDAYATCMTTSRAEVAQNPLIRLPPEMNMVCACAAGAMLIAGNGPPDPDKAAKARGCFRAFTGSP